ncbi:MarR family winged helix-turn-helix transcriptional regulator [Paenibacillus macquariensis]|uniref:DNA-binding transcriptional regulator, MarR family n=1 Tax=Paenibacillus macquariensis TaxID=948756 RepID=A0ABY1JRF6_9BACL|nr:MarR family transcriptional regulator [Paenibacillus macquariensis]MEC0092744.1 MarR family transcriptional regulator [Paenibacillus macquariensis]SIQ65254.1 DNA-binding transcriptional regulator, MarR family [Paenibacillus macquariensis]
MAKEVVILFRFSSPEQAIGYKYTPVFRKISALFAYQLRPYDITPEQRSVLYQLYLEEGINQKEIALRTDKDQPTVTRILDVLDKKQLIIRHTDPADRRAFLICATDSAKKLILDTIPLELALNDLLVSGVTDEQLELFEHIMQQIKHNIDKIDQNKESSKE